MFVNVCPHRYAEEFPLKGLIEDLTLRTVKGKKIQVDGAREVAYEVWG